MDKHITAKEAAEALRVAIETNPSLAEPLADVFDLLTRLEQYKLSHTGAWLHMALKLKDGMSELTCLTEPLPLREYDVQVSIYESSIDMGCGNKGVGYDAFGGVNLVVCQDLDSGDDPELYPVSFDEEEE